MDIILIKLDEFNMILIKNPKNKNVFSDAWQKGDIFYWD